MRDTDVEIGQISVILSFCSAVLGTASIHTSKGFSFNYITQYMKQFFLSQPAIHSLTLLQREKELYWISTELSTFAPLIRDTTLFQEWKNQAAALRRMLTDMSLYLDLCLLILAH